jgi:hypothetical protein
MDSGAKMHSNPISEILSITVDMMLIAIKIFILGQF